MGVSRLFANPKLFWLLMAVLGLALAVDNDDDTNTASNSDDDNKKKQKAQAYEYGSAFFAALSSIVVSELGDKTFFIAAIMAMRYNRIAVYLGAAFALFLMTAISTAFGWVVPVLIPPKVTHIIVTVLFFFFGGKLLYDAYNHEEGENEEAAEAEAQLDEVHTRLMQEKKNKKQHNSDYDNDHDGVVVDAETGGIPLGDNDDIEAPSPNKVRKVQGSEIAVTYVFWQALTLTFLGEWGDRSQITTIALASANNAYLVFIGAFLGHAFCTGLAVIGGKYLAKKISERMVNISGGVLFLIFGIHNVLFA